MVSYSEKTVQPEARRLEVHTVFGDASLRSMVFFEHRAQAPVGLHRRIACYRLVAVARGGEFKGVGKALHNVPRGVCSGFSVLVVLTLTSARRLQVPNCTLRNVAVWSKANTARMGSALTIKQLIHLAA